MYVCYLFFPINNNNNNNNNNNKNTAFLFSKSRERTVDICYSVDFRWTQELDDLTKQRSRLIGDCLLGSSFLCYAGAFTWEFRHEMIYNMWCSDLVKRNIPISKPFRLEALLTNEVEVSRYAIGSSRISG